MDQKANLVETITSLAMLKVNADTRDRDYLDYLVPFVSAIIARQNDKPIDRETVRRGIRTEFGLRIPAGPVDMLLRRLVKRGVLQVDHGVYVVKAKFAPPDFEPKRVAARQSMTRVITRLTEFGKAKEVEGFDENAAVIALTAYLSRFCIECLETFAQGTALPTVPSTTPANLFLVNQFIQHALEHEADLFEDVVVLVKGHMLANALICPDLEGLQRKFAEITFYLDTPFILELLSVPSDPKCLAATELLDLLKKLRADVAVFHHTAQEVDKVLQSCEKHLDDPNARARLVIEMRKAGQTRSDLALVRARLDKFFGSHGIARVPTPKHVVEFQIDESVLTAALDEEIHYWNPRALDYDVKSIRSIYTLRRGLAPTRLESARAVLVTSNFRLARTAFDFGKQHESTREVSSVITDFSLANVAWLKAPLGSDLPRREIIANCYAAMEPPTNLWVKYLDEIQKLKSRGEISAADHEALRLSLRAREELMNLTRGEEQAFTAETVNGILERVKDEFTKEHIDSLAAERAAHEKTKLKLGSIEADREQHRKTLFWRSRIVGRCAGAATFIGVTAGLLVSALLTTEKFGPYLRDRWTTASVTFVIFFAIVWGLLNAIFGISVWELGASVSRSVARWRYRRTCRLAQIPPD